MDGAACVVALDMIASRNDESIGKKEEADSYMKANVHSTGHLTSVLAMPFKRGAVPPYFVNVPPYCV